MGYGVEASLGAWNASVHGALGCFSWPLVLRVRVCILHLHLHPESESESHIDAGALCLCLCLCLPYAPVSVSSW